MLRTTGTVMFALEGATVQLAVECMWLPGRAIFEMCSALFPDCGDAQREAWRGGPWHGLEVTSSMGDLETQL